MGRETMASFDERVRGHPKGGVSGSAFDRQNYKILIIINDIAKNCS